MAALAPSHVFVFPLEMRFAVRVNREVGIVSSVVTFRIFQSMLLAIGVEMWACGLEVRGLALCILMKMDGVFAGRQILDVDFHADSRAGLPQNCAAYYLALSIFKLNQNFGRTGRGECDHEQSEGEQASGFHAGIIAKVGALALRVRDINLAFT
jgi:hypothetical protein